MYLRGIQSKKDDSSSAFKIEFAMLLSDVEKLAKTGRKKEALIKLIAARVRLNEADIDEDLRERGEMQLAELRTKIKSM